MGLPDIDLTGGTDFDLIELRTRIDREQQRRTAMQAAKAQLEAAVQAIVGAGGCRDDIIRAVQEDDPDPEPGGADEGTPGDGEPDEGDDAGDPEPGGEPDPEPGDDETPPA